jgi:hypothetical protein
MRRLIAIALSLLCIALPLRTVADAVVSDQHCPMMQAHVQSDVQPQAPGDHDCCNDAATFAKTGQLCKMGQECSPPMAYPLPPTVSLAVITAQHTETTTLFTRLHTRPPAAVWRPPSLS